jgi:hypothetical protein
MPKLMLHAGGQIVTREDLRAVPVPESRGRFHRPIPHAEVVDALFSKFAACGLAPAGDGQYGLSKDGGKLFGIIEFRAETMIRTSLENSLMLGFRSSTDESFSLQGMAGSHLFICDNLAFSGGEFLFTRKHTLHVNLSYVIERGLEKFAVAGRDMATEFSRLAETEVSDDRAARIFAQMIQYKTLPDRYAAESVRNYFAPVAADCEPRTLWGIHNAATRALRETSITARVEHSQSVSRFLSVAA